jgi:peptide/nickel transport system substrate-binding protein
MRKRMRKCTLFFVSAICLIGLSVTGCGNNKKSQANDKASVNAGEAGFIRNQTLYLGGDQWGDPNTFNPLCDWPA